MVLRGSKMAISGAYAQAGGKKQFEAGHAPRVNLRATHVRTLEFVDLADLEKFAI